MQGSRVRSLTTWSQAYGAEPITQVRPCVARPRVAARRGGVGGRVWLRRRGPPPPTATTGPSETETPAASSFSPTAVPETPTSTPTALGNAPADSPTPTATEAGTSTPVRQSTPSPTSTVRPSPTREPTSTPTPPKPISLRVLAPLDGAGLEVASVRVIGSTSAPTVAINGLPIDVNEDGSFLRDLPLRDGVNLIEVVASDTAGQAVSQQLVVFVVTPAAGLPLTLLYPFDGVEVSEPFISVMGITRPDAVVGVNEIPAEINPLGIFSITIPLEIGSNLIEVVVVDIHDNVRFQTVVVFYAP